MSTLGLRFLCQFVPKHAYNRPTHIPGSFVSTPLVSLVSWSKPLKQRRSSTMSSTSGATTSMTAPPGVEDEEAFWAQVLPHQKNAARLSAVEDARTLIDQSHIATLSTISQRFEGFPWGSPVEIAADEDGTPLVSISTVAPHTENLEKNPKCTLLIMKDPTDRTDTVITLLCEAYFISQEEHSHVRDCYLRKHPKAFWVDFGDFRFARLVPKRVRYVRGSATPVATFQELSIDEFKHAAVDPIAQFSTPVAEHMNKDHADDTCRIVEKSIGVKVDHAKIIDLDALGLNVQVGYNKNLIKLRIPFPRRAENRKDVKNLIVEMLRTDGTSE